MGIRITKPSQARAKIQQTPPDERPPGSPALPDEVAQESGAHKARAEAAGRPDAYDVDPERNTQGEQNMSEGLRSSTTAEESAAGEKKDRTKERVENFDKLAENAKEKAAGNKSDEKSKRDAASKAPPPEPKPLPKTSPSPRLGDTVLFRTQEKAKKFNGTDVHVAIITRNWGKCVNLKVLPDCGEPYDATSVARIAYQDEEAQGWFHIGEAQG